MEAEEKLLAEATAPRLEPSTETELGDEERPLRELCPRALADTPLSTVFPQLKTGNESAVFQSLFAPKYKPSSYWTSKNFAAPPVATPSSSTEVADAETTDTQLDEVDLMLRGDLDADSAQPSSVPSWRIGPAKLWYDLVDAPLSGEGFTYGMKKSTEKKPLIDIPAILKKPAIPMINHCEWWKDILWTPEQAQEYVRNMDPRKVALAGWLPSSEARTMLQFYETWKKPLPGINVPLVRQMLVDYDEAVRRGEPARLPYSFFPEENEALKTGAWLNDVIIDPDAVTEILQPRLVSPPQWDDLGCVTDDEESAESGDEDPTVLKSKRVSKGLKKSQERERLAAAAAKDPFNASNDEFYFPRMEQELTAGTLQHATPAIHMRQLYFPSNWTLSRRRYTHRPLLKRSVAQSDGKAMHYNVYPVVKQLTKKAREREDEIVASGGGQVFFMRSNEDLSAKDGTVVLMEYCEQFPMLLAQTGMASRFVNYYKKRSGEQPPGQRYGQLQSVHSSPYIGPLSSGQLVPSFENNMFRAPLYQHESPRTDFLLIRCRNRLFLRPVEHAFTVGQQCPLIEVPAPNSKGALNFTRDFILLHLYRLFWLSTENPRRVRMEDVRKLFPDQSESSIRKRLKLCADFRRQGGDQGCWLLKEDFRLPSEDEVRLLVTPEQYCCNMGRAAGEQRLRDAGYGEKSNLTIDEGQDDEQRIEDEIAAAPWNTSRAYIAASRGKCVLALTGPADPTGCGRGFSYIRASTRQNKDEQGKKLITGTTADLRRLNLKEAKAMLRRYNISDKEISKLTRWECIDVIRTMSTEQARQGNENKYARISKNTSSDAIQKFRDEAALLQETQAHELGSSQLLSTDDEQDDSDGDSSDVDQTCRSVESMLTSRDTAETSQRTEEDRAALRDALKRTPRPSFKAGQVLEVTREYRTGDGEVLRKTETVRRPELVQMYMRLREAAGPDLLGQLAQPDEEEREKTKRERRKLQEQLRRLRKMHETREQITPKPPKITVKAPVNPKVRCSACNELGHMKTNRDCPKYGQVLGVAMTEEQLEEESARIIDTGKAAVRVDGRKLVLSKEHLDEFERLKRESLKIRIPKAMAPAPGPGRGRGRKPKVVPDQTQSTGPIETSTIPDEDTIDSDISEDPVPMSPAATTSQLAKEKRELEKKKKTAMKRKAQAQDELDYLKGPKKTTKRRLVDPLVSLATIFEEILQLLRSKAEFAAFFQPVNTKKYVDYLTVVTEPIDLQTMRQRAQDKQYSSRGDFLRDATQIYRNSQLYSGDYHYMTIAAQRLLNECVQLIASREKQLIKLEKAVNPLLEDDDSKAMAFIFGQILEQMRAVEGSYPFHEPVNKKVPNYYNLVKEPMDLGSMTRRLRRGLYTSVAEFSHDVDLIHANCLQFNGPQHALTPVAAAITQAAHSSLEAFADRIAEYEPNVHSDRDSHTTRDLVSEGGLPEPEDNCSLFSGGQSALMDWDEDLLLQRPDSEFDFTSQGLYSDGVGSELDAHIDVQAGDEDLALSDSGDSMA